ncbi:hypothetical protein SCG7086_AC_00230 [Chlamydiales bacterium SCGC AG-110-P3]|nr:hypothetical protein SCG7086_AC_00230 [Chlamydiales bacterium SCGC AG-110-P3]
MSKELNLFNANETDDNSALELPCTTKPTQEYTCKDESIPENASEIVAKMEASSGESVSTPFATEPTPATREPLPEAVTGSHLARMIDKIQERKDRDNAEIELIEKGKRIIEALLFASNEPLSFNRIRDIIEVKYPIKPRNLKQAIAELRSEYVQQNRAFRLEEVGNGYLLRSCEEYSVFIDQVYRNRRTEKLSHAATEVLAIISHRQPITRPQIDAIRGVDSSGTVAALTERGLIEAVGRLEAPGRPTLYSVTQDFLKYFGLKSASDLPVEEIAP